MDLSKNSNIKDLLEFAHSRRFSHEIKFSKIHFYPHEMDWNTYLTISVDEKTENLEFTIKAHKFLKTEQHIDKKVSNEWLKGFFNFRSKDAKEDIDEFLHRRRLNEKIIKENESLNLDDSSQENILANSGLSSGRLDFNLSDEIGGPHNEDWDSRDWQDYMSGPDFEDGEPQW